MLQKIKLVRVQYMPKTLEPGILYVSEEFGAVAHLCACGCGAKIRTPIGPTGWRFEDSDNGPSLHPSIGNWQQACQSHYFIRDGEIISAPKWTKAEIESGRNYERARDRAHYERKGRKRRGISALWDWLQGKIRS